MRRANFNFRIFGISALLAALVCPAAGAGTEGTESNVGRTKISDVATYYAVIGGITAWGCHRDRDPTACDQFLKQLYDPLQLGKMALWVVISDEIKIRGARAGFPLVGEYGGTTAAFLVTDLLDELWKMPEFQQLRKAKDRGKREALLKAIYERTFKNPEWRRNQIPQLASILVAASAASGTIQGLKKVRGKVWPSKNEKNEEAESESETSSCPSRYARIVDALKRRKDVVLELLLIQEYRKLFRSFFDEQWDSMNVESDLAASRKELKNIPVITDAPIQKNSRLWSLYRKEKMAPIESLRLEYLQSLTELDASTGRTADFYNWFAHGMKSDDPSWRRLRDRYFDQKTRPEDIRSETEENLKSFFCGENPRSAFRDSEDYSGIPVPGRTSPEVLPYRVARLNQLDGMDPCQGGFPASRLQEAIQGGHYDSEVAQANASVQAEVQKARAKRVDRYEKKISTELGQILEGSVIPSFNTQIVELLEFSAKDGDAAHRARLQAEIEHLRETRDIAQSLLDYFCADPEKRGPPKLDPVQWLKSIAAEPDAPEWKKEERYFEMFMM